MIRNRPPIIWHTRAEEPAPGECADRGSTGLPIDRSDGTATDRLGCHGVAFWTATRAMAVRLITDPRTGRLPAHRL